MKKWLIIVTYFLVFWIGLPALLFGIAEVLEPRLGSGLPSLASANLFGYITLPIFTTLFLLSVMQFKMYSGQWPVSAYPPDRLIRKGLYIWWRHPIYVFFDITLLSAGIAISSSSFVLIVFPVYLIFHYIYIKREESRLLKRFPGQYAWYRRSTGLIIPRLYQLLRIPFHFLFKYLYKYKADVNLEALPEPPFFIVSNHNNYLDPLLISKAIPYPIAYVTTFEMYRSRLKQFIFNRLFSIPKRRMQPDLRATKSIINEIKSGAVVGIFPEGERSWSGQPGPIKPEVIKLLFHFNQIPIVPVRIKGSYTGWPRWGTFPRKSEISVEVLPPMKASQFEGESDFLEKLKCELRTTSIGQCHSRSYHSDVTKLIYRCPVCFTFESLSLQRNNQFLCNRCRTDFNMNSDYSISFQYNNQHHCFPINVLYEKIKIREKDIIPDSMISVSEDLEEPVLGVINGASFAIESGRRFINISKGPILITAHEIIIDCRPQLSIPVSGIRYVVVEGNSKLQFYSVLEYMVYQIKLTTGSILRWKDFLVVAIKKHYNIEVVES